MLNLSGTFLFTSYSSPQTNNVGVRTFILEIEMIELESCGIGIVSQYLIPKAISESFIIRDSAQLHPSEQHNFISTNANQD